MRRLLAALIALCALSPVRAELVEAPSFSAPEQEAKSSPSPSSGQTVERAETPDQVARCYKLAGELLVAKGDRVLLDKGYGMIAPGGTAQHRAGARWRLASITKQVTATLLLRADVDALDRPFVVKGALLGVPVFGPESGLTLRMLLTHHSGIANPDDTPPGPGGVPAFYLAAPSGQASQQYPYQGYCVSKPPKPNSPFSYNNCDYILAATDWMSAWPAGMVMARAGEMGVPGFIAGKPEPHYELASFGAAGGLVGTSRALFRFDRSLMTGKVLPPAALAELWKPEGRGSYQALGQWVFPGQLKGCAKPKRIVQRDGEIGGVQARNYIFPDDDLVVIVFTNRSSDDFPIGEVWEGKGFAYDLLSAVACS